MSDIVLKSTSRLFSAVAVMCATLLLAGCGVNNIPTYENQAKAAWAEVLNQYKRRADLVPGGRTQQPAAIGRYGAHRPAGHGGRAHRSP